MAGHNRYGFHLKFRVVSNPASAQPIRPYARGNWMLWAGRSYTSNQRKVFRREDDVEAARRRADQLLFCQAVQRQLGGGGGNAERRLRLAGGKVIPGTGGKTANISSRSWTAIFRKRHRKVSLFDTLRRQSISLRNSRKKTGQKPSMLSAGDSKFSVRKDMRVQIPPSAPLRKAGQLAWACDPPTRR